MPPRVPPRVPRQARTDYVARERTAPVAIRDLLATQRREIRARKLRFTVGYTTALDRPLERLTGILVPANLRARMSAQRAIARVFSILDLNTPLGAAALPHFDWRDHGAVTGVRDQGACGSCWDFAAIGAFEGNYAKRAGTLIDASEQDALDCNGEGDCGGGWPEYVFKLLKQKGVADEATVPYRATEGTCRSVTRRYRAREWDYVADDDGVPSVLRLKAALAKHGPLAVCVRVTALFQAYTSGVFDEDASGDVNHCVTLVGWDDPTSSWIIKNSWGSGWGDGGYMNIAYGCNKIGYGAAWVQARVDALGMIAYSWTNGALTTRWGTRDMGQGYAALDFLAADINNDGKAELLQPWKNGSKLGLIAYHWTGSGLATLWGAANMGHHADALAWRVGDVDGDGKSELLQPWKNGDRLGFAVYGWDGSAMMKRWSTTNIGQGPGALAWRVADIDGDGRREVLQPWKNGSRLGLIAYHWSGNKLTTKWGTQNIGQGPGALAWLTGDVDGDGRSELLQPWANGSKLGLIVYGWNGSAMTTKWGTTNIGQGPGAIDWLMADVDGDGQRELVQLWKNGSRLGCIVYGWTGSAMTTQWGTADIGQGAGALKFLAADVDGDGRAEILQLWDNGGRLGVIVYGWTGSALTTKWGTPNIGQGSGALDWVMADVDGDGRAELLQPWHQP